MSVEGLEKLREKIAVIVQIALTGEKMSGKQSDHAELFADRIWLLITRKENRALLAAGTEGPEEVDVIVKRIFEEHPSGDEDFAGLGRYIWPERFDALVKAFKARVEGEKK